MVQRGRPQLDEDLARAGHRIGGVLVAEDLGPAVLVDAGSPSPGTIFDMTAGRAGAARPRSSGSTSSARRPRPPYERDRAAHPRAARARPLRRHALHDGAAGGVVSPGDAAAGARTVVSAALCYYAPEPRPRPARGGCRATRGTTRYAALRERLDELGRRLGGDVPRARRREPARRPRGGGARRGRLLRQEHDADHAAARLLGRARHARHRRRARADAAARADCGDVPPLHRRLSDRRARRARRPRLDALPLVLDAGAGADSGGLPRARSAPRSTAATSARTSARGTAAIEKRRAARRAARRTRAARLAWSTGSKRTATSSRRRYERLYVPRNDAALPAAQCPRCARQHRRTGGRRARRAVLR